MTSRAKSPMFGRTGRMSGGFRDDMPLERPKSSTMRSFLNRLTGKNSKTTIPAPTARVQPQEVPLVVRYFVDRLDKERISDLLVWYLYYDIVKLPESPSQWYKPIDSMDMRGWIALGNFLSTGTQYGLHLVVLDSICDRLQLEKRVLHECIQKVADPDKMRWTTLATVLHTAKQERKTELDGLELVKSNLWSLMRLANCLKPTLDSRLATWHTQIVQRLHNYIHAIVDPQITAVRGGTCGPLRISEAEERELMFFYEMMQQERHVPLVRYGIFPDSYLTSSDSSSAASGDGHVVPALPDELLNHDCEIERSYSAASLRAQNRLLRAKVMQLENEKWKLENSNIKLAKKAGRVTRGQPQDYLGPLTPINREAGLPHAQSPPAAGSPCDRDSLPSLRSWNTGSADGSVGTPPSAVRRRTAPPLGNYSLAMNDEAVARNSSLLPPPSPHAPTSSEFGSMFEGFDTRSPSLSLLIPTSGNHTPPSSPPDLGVSGWSSDHDRFNVRRKAIGHSTFDSNGSTLVEKLPRNQGVLDLYKVCGSSANQWLDSSPRRRRLSRSLSSSSRRSETTYSEPSPTNSMEEYRARQVNVDEVQQPVGPYLKRSGSNTAKDLISRRASDAVLRKDTSKAQRRRSWSLGSTLRKDGIDGTGKLEFSPSTNF
ncbi:hypothetical protein K491DRAFT_484853 [Lophiostoma macrostomum CBS 122681]|uniref:Uncharacterized protein n=1 Tax=Lophiostoma macrostomum CBS 122681 TaxID=1314788 RepID=A0A6A6T6S3_9PLEO|nr:hypothetical protein K491DRAFT_484853 [Lophiostoma macrostomum CBS 122681]